MPSRFLENYMQGWQMGMSLNESRRRDQELQMEQQRQQQDQERRSAMFQLEQEEFKLRKKQIAAEEHASRLNAAKEAFQLRSQAASMQGLQAPTAADVGIPEQSPEMAGPMASQVNVPQPMQALPNPMEGQPDIQMPVLTGRQQDEMARAEQQKKMREALMMRQFTQKTPEEIGAESYARARGERMGNPPQPRAEPQGSWTEAVGPDGKPILFNAVTGATRAFPAGVSPKAKPGGTSSGQEKQVLAFYNRAKQATEDIAPIEDKITKAGPIDQLQLQYGYNWMQSPVQQQYRQAQRAFTEARLRKESGAAIAAHEYENDSKVYFAQPGDSPQAVEQKRRARAAVLDGLRFSAGRAYQEYYGEHAPGAPPSTGGSGIDPEVERAIQEARDKGLI